MRYLKYIVAFLPARALFLASDLVSWRCFDPNPDSDDDESEIQNIRWDLYQWCMAQSLRLDDWGKTNLWSKP